MSKQNTETIFGVLVLEVFLAKKQRKRNTRVSLLCSLFLFSPNNCSRGGIVVVGVVDGPLFLIITAFDVVNLLCRGSGTDQYRCRRGRTIVIGVSFLMWYNGVKNGGWLLRRLLHSQLLKNGRVCEGSKGRFC